MTDKEKLIKRLENIFDDVLSCKRLTTNEKLINNLQKALEQILVADKRAREQDCDS